MKCVSSIPWQNFSEMNSDLACVISPIVPHCKYLLINTLWLRQNGRYFTDDIFKRISLNEDVWIFINNCLMYIPRGAIDSISGLVQIMDWCRIGDKPLSQSVMAYFICVSLCLSEFWNILTCLCPACRTYEIATIFWVVVICPIIKCLTVLEFSFILFDLCLFITIFNFILNYVLIVTLWIFTYHKIWILLIIYCFIWTHWFVYILKCLEVFGVLCVNWCQFAVDQDGLG